MSRPPRVVPWRTEAELDDLKQLFYQFEENDQRQTALFKTEAYRTRGPIPQSMEATAMLTSAVLYDVPDNDPLAIRMTYSTAIVRFVNGLLDPLQKARDAISLYALAKQLDLPTVFVELRHVATHEGLPSLMLLRRSSHQALEWLWWNYWNAQPTQFQTQEVASSGEIINPADVEARKQQIKDKFRQWRRMRRADPKRMFKVGDSSKEGVQFWNLVSQLEQLLLEDESSFFNVLRFQNILIPIDAKGTVKDKASVDSHIKLLDPLFNLLQQRVEGFVQKVALFLVAQLAECSRSFDLTAPMGSASEEPKNVQQAELESSHLQKWVIFLLSHPNWITDARQIALECLKMCNPHALAILRYYIEKYEDSSLTKLAEDMHHSSTIPSDSPDGPSDLDAIEQELEHFRHRLTNGPNGQPNNPSTAANSQDSWVLCPNWTPRPIGVL